jgi:hypothetical protein
MERKVVIHIGTIMKMDIWGLYIGAHFLILGIIKKSYTIFGQIGLEMRLHIFLKVFVVLLNMLQENASFTKLYRSWY